MRKNSLVFWVFTALIVLLTMCKSKDLVSPLLTTIKFELKDDSSRYISGARVYLFRSLSDWETSKANREAANAIDSTVSVEGKAKINIDPDIDYYLLVMYKDPKRKITMLNVDYDSTITNLRKNIDVTVLINLKPVDGNLGFFSTAKLISPVTIDIRNVNGIYTLRNNRLSVPIFASDTGQLLVNLPPGTYRYQAKNASGCIWTGEQILNIGGFNKIDLGDCNFGNVVFYTKPENATALPITITINEDSDQIGDLNATRAIYLCGDADEIGTVKAVKASGKYTYSAQSSEGKCLWTGKFEVSANECRVVNLGKCE